MPGIASAATSIVIAHVAAGTSTIRVGAGGIMLPNHAPLMVAEQFGTLESLFPGRIDLGLGRAPGTDMARRARCAARSRRIRRSSRRTSWSSCATSSPRSRDSRSSRCRAPASRCRSGSSARACSVRRWRRCSGCRSRSRRTSRRRISMPAIEIYRERFEPSKQLERPYVMLGFNVFAADSDDEARFLATIHAAGVREPAQRPPVDAAAAGARLRGRALRRRARAARAGARVLGDRRTRARAQRAGGVRRAHRGRRADDQRDDLRPRRAAALVTRSRRPRRPAFRWGATPRGGAPRG